MCLVRSLAKQHLSVQRHITIMVFRCSKWPGLTRMCWGELLKEEVVTLFISFLFLQVVIAIVHSR